MKKHTFISGKSIITLFASTLLFLSTDNLTAQSGIELYGMTQYGGANGLGTIFKCTTSGNITTLNSFADTNGANPWGNLIKAYDGNLYGMTLYGGSDNMGVIFKMALDGSYSTFVNFADSNGANPYGSLCQAKDSNFYGMTYNGGIYSSCVCFKCSPTGNVNILFDFLGPTGDFPFGNIMQASNGNLYGMTTMGGDNEFGTLFVKSPLDTLTQLLQFNDTDGAQPYGSLIQADDGNLYGMTSGQEMFSDSGIGDFSLTKYGTIFKCTTSGQLTTIYTFDSIHGETPYGSLLQASDGNLYGMTWGGGKNSGSYGTIFKCSLTGTLTTLVNFDSNNGANPHGSLIQAGDGFLYGMTSKGGKYGYGTIFKCSLAGALTTLVSFDNTNNGATPYGDLLVLNGGTGVNEIANDYQANLYPNPNNGLFTVSINGIHEKSEIQVYNLLGENIYTAPVYPGNTQVNMGNKPAGVYLYRIITTTGALIKEGKIVVE